MKNLKQQLLLIICVLFSMQVQAAIVGFSADSISLKAGETLEFSIFATDFDELAGGTIDFSLSSLSFISIDEVVVDSSWDLFPDKGELNGSTWKGIGFDVFANEPLNGDGLIATISITGLKAGVTTLSLLDSSTFFNKIDELDSAGIINNASIDISTVDVSQVPVPAAIWFMGSALLGLVGLRRKTL